MSEEPTEYHTGRTARAEPPLTVDGLVTKAHANRQGIPYDSRGVLLQKLPGLLRALTDHVLGGKINAGAYSVCGSRTDRQPRKRPG